MQTKITKIKTKGGQWGMPIAITLEELADDIRSTRRLYQATRFYRQLQKARMEADGGDTRPKSGDTLPYLIFSSLFRRKGTGYFQQSTGLIMLTINTGGDRQKIAVLRHLAEQLPQTVMVFTGVSRLTLKVVVSCRPAMGLLPQDDTEQLAFLERAQRQAASYYGAMLKCSVPYPQASLTNGCRMSYDADVYVNPKAQPLTIINDTTGIDGDYPLAHTDEQGMTDSSLVEDCIREEQADFYTCMKKAQEETADGGNAEATAMHDEQLVVMLAQLCRKSGLDEETSVRRTLFHRHLKVEESIIRKIFRNAYRKHHEGKPWSQMSEKERIARKVEEFFHRRYELRYNTMKAIEEFRPHGIGHRPWLPLTTRDINRIAHEQMIEAGAAWPIDIEQYARSTLAPDYNPIHEFLAGCGQWNHKQDYIGQLAQRVPCQFAEWNTLFHRWFLGMVAAWLGKSRDFSNALVPMLVGRQGTRKSTFCKLLLPVSLREYYIDDIKLDNAEQVERMLARMALVNIDEYNAKTDREQAKIKRILTEHDVQVRRMRSEQYTMTRRMASFIATTNERQPLTDNTGNRRYLCVEVTGTIDTETPVNYQQLYAQAVWEINNGVPYYPSKEEEAVIEENNRAFTNASTTEILLAAYYQPASRAKETFIRATDILADLQQHAKGSDRPTMKQLIKALKAAHYEYGAREGQRGWYAERVGDGGLTT